MDASDFDRLLDGERWKNPREPACEHGFSRAGRPCEQQRVSSGGGELECPACALLTAHVSKIRPFVSNATTLRFPHASRLGPAAEVLVGLAKIR